MSRPNPISLSRKNAETVIAKVAAMLPKKSPLTKFERDTLLSMSATGNLPDVEFGKKVVEHYRKSQAKKVKFAGEYGKENTGKGQYEPADKGEKSPV